MAEHLSILEPDEIYDLYALPVFDKDQQVLFFDLAEAERKEMLRYRTPVSRLYFMLQLGYFKAKQQFYTFDLKEVISDRDHLWERYFPRELIPASGIISKPTRLAQQKAIIELQQFKRAD